MQRNAGGRIIATAGLDSLFLIYGVALGLTLLLSLVMISDDAADKADERIVVESTVFDRETTN